MVAAGTRPRARQGGAPEGSPSGAPRPPRSAVRMFCSTVLTLEAFVVFFAALAAYGLRTAPGPVLLAVGLGGALACVLIVGALRSRAGLVLGSLVQVALLAAGALVSDLRVHLLAVAITFAVIWAAAIMIGSRIDVERAERYRLELEHWAATGGAAGGAAGGSAASSDATDDDGGTPAPGSGTTR